MVGGGLGAGGGQKVPPISWGWRPEQKMGQVGKLLRERVQEGGRFRGHGGRFRCRAGCWWPKDGAVRPGHLEIEDLWVEKGEFISGLCFLSFFWEGDFYSPKLVPFAWSPVLPAPSCLLLSLVSESLPHLFERSISCESEFISLDFNCLLISALFPPLLPQLIQRYMQACIRLSRL